MLQPEIALNPSSSVRQERPSLLWAIEPPYLPAIVKAFGAFLLVMMIAWPRAIYFSLGGIGLNPYTGCAILAFLTLPLLVLFYRPAGMRAIAYLDRYWPLALAFCFLQIMGVVSGIYGEERGDSLKASYQQLLFVYAVFPVFAIYFLDGRLRLYYIRALIYASAIILPISVVEYLTQQSLFAMLHVDRFAAGEAGDLAQLVSSRMRDGAFRAQSTFSHPMILGQFSAAIFPLVWFTVRAERGFLRAVAFFVLMFIPAGVIVSGTRSAFIVVGFAGVLSFIFYGRGRQHAFAAMFVRLMLVLGMTGLAYGFLGDYAASVLNGRTAAEALSSETRGVEIAVGLQEFARSPVIGYGLARSQFHTKIINGNGMGTIDNLYLSIILDGGLLLALAWIVFVIAMAVAGLFAVANLRDKYARDSSKALLIMNLAVIFGGSMHSMLDLFPFMMVNIAYFTNQMISERASDASSQALSSPA